jgi:EmrB/QacA subfamily drug resistance transporter
VSDSQVGDAMTATDVLPSSLTLAPPRAVARGNRTATLVVVHAVTAMLMLDIAVVNTALPSIGVALHSGLSGVQWVVDAYTVALAAVVLTAGSLADRFGRRRALLVGLALFTAASGVCAGAPSIGVLDAARAVQSLGGAILFACSLAVLSHLCPDPVDRTKVLAGYGATIGGSFALGPLVGGLLTEGADWRWIFLVNVPIGVLCLALTARGVAESRDPSPRRVDVPGQLALSAALFLLVLGLLRTGADGWTSPLVTGCLAAGGALLVVFVVVEAHRAEPMLPLRMFRNRTFAATQIAAFGISASLFAVFLYTTIYLQGVLHFSPLQAGAAYLPGTVVMFCTAGITAQLQSRIAAGAALCVSLAVVGAGLLLLLLAGPHSSWLWTLPGLILASAASGVFNPVMSGLVLREADEGRAGLATGVNDSFRQTGIALGVAVLGVFMPAIDRIGADPIGYTTGLHHALLLGAAVALVGAAVAALLLRRPKGAAGVEDAAIALRGRRAIDTLR